MSKGKHRPRPAPTPAPLPDRTPIGDLTLTIGELVASYDTLERYTWHKPKTTHTERREHRTSGKGLLIQLAEAAGVRDDDVEHAALVGAQRQDEGGHSKPGSRLPAGSVFVDEYARVVTEIWALRADLAQAQGIRWLPGGDPVEALGDVLNLMPRSSPTQQQRAARAGASWARAIRVVLAYEAPWVELRNRCPDCNGILHVRADAGSDVFCHGDPASATVPWHPEGCEGRWPRGMWVGLLVQMKGKDPA